MKGYVARKGDRYYAVIYEGIDPITGRERRRWHPAGTDLNDAETLAAHLARRRHDDGYERSSLTVAVYLTQRWLPSKALVLRASTHDSYRRNTEIHHECACLGVAHDVRHLVEGEVPVDRREPEAGSPARRPHLHELGPVPAHQRDAVTGPEPACPQALHELVRAGVERGEGAIAMW